MELLVLYFCFKSSAYDLVTWWIINVERIFWNLELWLVTFAYPQPIALLSHISCKVLELAHMILRY